MERIKKVGVSAGALIIIFVLLSVASVTHNMNKTGAQVIEPWTPIPGMFGGTKASVGQAISYPQQIETKSSQDQALTPKNIQYYINGIMIPKVSAGEIQLKDDKIRTYEGKFGPYPYSPVQNLVIKICAQNRYESDAPTCEQITSVAFIDGYVVFGYANKPDEYIGYYPRRQFTTYFEVYSKDGTLLSKSNTGKVRLSYV